MAKTSNKNTISWASLNKRQQAYLKAIYDADQEVEQAERGRWHIGAQPRPAEEWRWMLYAALNGHDLPVKRHLTLTRQIDEGTGSTLDALERRQLIVVRYDITSYNGEEILTGEPIPAIQITKAGRALVRQALGLSFGKQVVGTLQGWHWRALARAYEAGEKGVPDDRYGYGRIGWNTWVRLRNYTIRGNDYPLIEQRGGIVITGWGVGFYKRSYARYHELYPKIVAPAVQCDPLEPYQEIYQSHRTCRACDGEYLVSVTRIYQQDRRGAWSVEETDQRIPGEYKPRYGEMEQCRCMESDIQEIKAPFLALLDQLAEQGWQLSFPYHHWITYLDYLVGGVASGRERRWYDPAQVRAKVLPLREDETDIEDNRNVVKGEMRYCYNARVGRGKIYLPGLNGEWSPRPIVSTRSKEDL